MTSKTIFLSEGNLCELKDGEIIVHTNQAYENYKQSIKEINKKKEWKTTGTGAQFTGAYYAAGDDADLEKMASISGICPCSDGKVVYAFNAENTGGLYITDLQNPQEKDAFIRVDQRLHFHDMDVNNENKIIVTMGDSYNNKHLALMEIGSVDYNVLTEGDCIDSSPKWSKKYPNVVYYDSCGIGYDQYGNFGGYGPKSIYKLNITTRDLEEVLEKEGHDLYSPYEDEHGNLYYLQRPYKTIKKEPMSIKDFLLAPFKILRAIGGWLDFFTMRYSGESLKTSGANPAVTPKKSKEELFIEGNLVKATENMKKNARLGERNPGYIPSDWRLMMKSVTGEEKIIKKGVLSYCVTSDGVLYTNGKYIIHATDQSEQVIAKSHMATKISSLV